MGTRRCAWGPAGVDGDQMVSLYDKKISLDDNERCLWRTRKCFQYFCCNIYRPQLEIVNNKVNYIVPKLSQYSHKDKVTVFLYGYNLASEEFNCRNISITFSV